MHQALWYMVTMAYIWITFNYSYAISQIHKGYDKISMFPILALCQIYFTCIKPLWWMITVSNMNKTHSFISDINHYIQNVWNNGHVTFWHSGKVYFTCIKPLLWLITVPNVNKNWPILLLHNTQNLWKNVLNCLNLAQCQILFYMIYQQYIIPGYCTKYEQNNHRKLPKCRKISL